SLVKFVVFDRIVGLDGTVCAFAMKFESTTIVVIMNSIDKYPLPIISFLREILSFNGLQKF
ncbi:MAG TPA: hypothetical protein VNB67_00675, partial [Nitrososphaeraceae archaeon]|nr:hypothetical protein [Nitrososphaeraceae archaeon]